MFRVGLWVRLPVTLGVPLKVESESMRYVRRSPFHLSMGWLVSLEVASYRSVVVGVSVPEASVASFHSWVAVRVAGDCARLLYFRRPSGEVPAFFPRCGPVKVHAAVAYSAPVVFGPATLLRLVLANARVMLVTVLDDEPVDGSPSVRHG